MIEEIESGIRLNVYVQPNGKKNEIVGEHAGALKIRIQAVPVDGKANAAVEKFVAEIFDITSSRVKLIRGQQSRLKVVEIVGVTAADANRKLKEHGA